MKKEISEAEKIERAETEFKEKPIAVRVAELKMNLADAITSCKLPPCLIEPIIGNVYNQVAEAAAKELAAGMAAIKKEG